MGQTNQVVRGGKNTGCQNTDFKNKIGKCKNKIQILKLQEVGPRKTSAKKQNEPQYMQKRGD